MSLGGRLGWDTEESSQADPNASGATAANSQPSSDLSQASSASTGILAVLNNAYVRLLAFMTLLTVFIQGWPFLYQVASVVTSLFLFVSVKATVRLHQIVAFILAILLGGVALIWYYNHRPESNIALTELYFDEGPDDCYDGIDEEGSSLTLLGRKTVGYFVSCEYHEKTSSVERTYRFNLPSKYYGQRIIGFKGFFGVDEADTNPDFRGHEGAEATWTVSQAGQEFCTVKASWKSPAECRMKKAFTLQPDQQLEIKETLVKRGANPQQVLWLGIVRPQLVVRF